MVLLVIELCLCYVYCDATQQYAQKRSVGIANGTCLPAGEGRWCCLHHSFLRAPNTNQQRLR